MDPDEAYLILQANTHALRAHVEDMTMDQVAETVASMLTAWEALDLWKSGGGHSPRPWQLHEQAHAPQPDTSDMGYV